MLEVYPGVRVAPDEHGEEEGADGGREQHNHQTKQALVTGGHQRSVIQPSISGVSYTISRNQRVGTQAQRKRKNRKKINNYKNMYRYRYVARSEKISVSDTDPVFFSPGSGTEFFFLSTDSIWKNPDPF